jgi:PEP-CTERM motif
MKNSLKLGLVVALALLHANQAHAQPFNQPPPPGAILDLDGTPIPHSYKQYTTPTFIATSTTTNISFAFREDPAFLFLDDVTMKNVTKASAVPVVNGGFELGPVGASAPTGWTYLNMFGASFGGFVSNNNPHTGSNNYYDGAVQAYDGITQAISTNIGDSYTISFWLDDNGPYTTFSRLSTNGDNTDTGGNGVDLLVYAGAIPQMATPEPASLALVGLGIGTLLANKLRRKKKQA